MSQKRQKEQQWKGGYLSRRLEIRKVKKANYSLKEEIFVNLYLIYSSSLGKKIFFSCMHAGKFILRKVSIFSSWSLILVWKDFPL